MNITRTQAQGQAPVTVLALEGSLDGSNFGELIEAARESYAAGARSLLIDMSGLSYMSSAGLVALHAIVRLMRGEPLPDPEDGWGAFHAIERDQARGTVECVKLLRPQGKVENVLRKAGMEQFFEIYQDLPTALSSF